LDTVVRLAAGTKDSRLVALKQRLISALLATQDADGYIGTVKDPERESRLFGTCTKGLCRLGFGDRLSAIWIGRFAEGSGALGRFLRCKDDCDPNLRLNSNRTSSRLKLLA